MEKRLFAVLANRNVVRGIILAAVLGFIVLGAPQARATLIHSYQLNGSFTDDLSGPDLVPAGGTLGPMSYAFGPNQGLSLSNGLTNSANYSIETIFNFSTVTGYRKIIDFKDRSFDYGLYNLSTALNFYPVVTGPVSAFASDVDVRLIVPATVSLTNSPAILTAYSKLPSLIARITLFSRQRITSSSSSRTITLPEARHPLVSLSRSVSMMRRYPQRRLLPLAALPRLPFPNPQLSHYFRHWPCWNGSVWCKEKAVTQVICPR